MTDSLPCCTDKNECGGWAESRNAVVDINDRCRARGVRFATGEASAILHTHKNGRKDVAGVQTREGDKLYGDLVILATGAWTSKLLPALGAELLATGQTVGTIQMTPDEARRYADIPVSFYLDSGFYCFPPDGNGVFKFAIHGQGWIDPHQDKRIPSTPRTILQPEYATQEIPPSSRLLLETYLTALFPELAQREWKESRLCWYTGQSGSRALVADRS